MNKAEYEFEVTEPMTTCHTYLVQATTRAEALEKVLDGEYEQAWMNDVHPSRSMSVRDVKRLGRIDSVQP